MGVSVPYRIDEKDKLEALGVAAPDGVDPLPITLAKEGCAVISYISFINRKDVCVVVSFPWCHTHRYGPLKGHPLAERGLKECSAYEVKDSSWLRALDLKDKDASSRAWKHFVFAFRHTLYECIARDFGEEKIAEDDDTVRIMSRRLYK